YKYLNGTDWMSFITDSSNSTILTNDGMSYSFNLLSASCTFDKSSPANTTSSPFFNTCGTIKVDINGPNKGPSVAGRDLFVFLLTKKGLYPRGTYPSIPDVADNCSTHGSACGAKVLLESAMTY
ncbi:MAG: hypothetical protein WC197_09645, partial [Candidatus Gastranaerophilaceae bacterium]